MIIKILGTGCNSCRKLEENVKEAVKELGIKAEIKRVEDIPEIMKYGVMSVPALVINEEVKSYGIVNSVIDIKKMLMEYD